MKEERTLRSPVDDGVGGDPPEGLPKDGPSKSLESILGGPFVEKFMDEVWQEQCVVFRSNETNGVDDEDDDDSAFSELIRHGWDSVVGLLEHGKERFVDGDEDTVPLVFRSLHMVDPRSRYDGNLFHAYLDGCSIVMNHADWTCPYIAKLCLDLQKSFPHAYANTYLTPPNSQAVPPHADDRDVLIIQVMGKKKWKVYQNVPIPFPYSHEQVGKDGLEVPLGVLEGPCVLDVLLEEGDVLYMPRGFVHEARTTDTDPSFHVTVALATHDWTLAGIMTLATQHTLSRIVEYRKALPGKTDLAETVKKAFETLQRHITPERILENLAYKHARHNQMVQPMRQACIEQQQQTTTQQSVTLTSMTKSKTTKNRGLMVRECHADAITQVLQALKTRPCRVSQYHTLTTAAIDELTWLSLAKCCVEMGAMEVVD